MLFTQLQHMHRGLVAVTHASSMHGMKMRMNLTPRMLQIVGAVSPAGGDFSDPVCAATLGIVQVCVRRSDTVIALSNNHKIVSNRLLAYPQTIRINQYLVKCAPWVHKLTQ
jgi:vacuolar-type H+-ATPase catalytic subunit A/Vma1